MIDRPPIARRARPRRSILPLALVLILVLVAALAASRGDRATVATVSAPHADGSLGEPAAAAETAGSTDPQLAVEVTAGDGAATTPLPTVAPSGLDEPDETVANTGTAGEGRSIDELPVSGPGTFTYAPAAERPIGAAPYRPFSIATEDGTGVDPVELAALVDSILLDPRSWIGDGVTGFQRVGQGEPVDFTLVIATPSTVDVLCAPLQTVGKYSCGNNGWIALNLHRWETATDDWPASLATYRQYLVNHEVGHYLLGPIHEDCPAPGMEAPIMMQQSISLDGCSPNGWVYPDGT